MKVLNNVSFKAKFVDNRAFREVVKYAEETKQLDALDTALNRIDSIKGGDILLVHGKTQNGVYSNFNMDRRSLQNLGADTPEEASFKAIVELGELGRKFRRIVGGELKSTLSSEKIIDRYTGKN